MTSLPPSSPPQKTEQDAPRGASSRSVLPETTFLMALGCLDLFSTIYLLATRAGYEANPLFDTILQNFGPIGFIAFKVLMLGGPLTLAEWARKHNEPFVRRALRMGIILYIGFYLINFLRFNIHHFI